MHVSRSSSRGSRRAAAAWAVAGVLAGAPAARSDVLLSNFEPPLGDGLNGWFNYNGNITALGLVNNPPGGGSNWMSIEFNNTAGAWATAGPTIQPWANANFSDASFQAHNFLQFDAIFPSGSWLSNDPALPIGINTNGGGTGLLSSIDTTQKDVARHVVIDYSTYKSSNGGPGNVTDWMNLLFGHPDEAQWGGQPFAPRVYVDNVYLTATSAPPAPLPVPNNGTWDPTRSGNWSDTGNWVGGVVAHGNGSAATFGPAAAPRTVNVNPIGITLGRLVLDSASGYTFTGNAITLQSSAAAPNSNAVDVNAGSHAMPALTVNQAAADTTVFTVGANAALTVDNLAGGGFGAYRKEGAGSLTVDKMREVNLIINGGTVSLKPGNAQNNGFIFGLNVFNGSRFNLNGARLRANSVSSNEVPGTIDLGAGGAVMNFGIYGGASYFGAITGSGNLVLGALAATDPSAIGTPQTVTLGGDSSYAGSTTVTNGGTVVVEHHNALGSGALVMDPGTRVTLGPGFTSALRRTDLSIAGGAAPAATLDLADNALVVDYSGASPLGTIKAQVVSGFAGGAWNGQGITSSSADATQFGVAYAEASSLVPVPAVFGTVDGTAVLLRRTRYGDANLDGTVNLQDFNRLAANFGASNAVWSQGDFDYNGSVNLQDFNRLAANFGQVAASASVSPQAWANLAAAIPEPGGAGLLTGGALLCLRRRRASVSVNRI